MKNKFKKVVSALTVLTLLLGMLSVPASAAEATTADAGINEPRVMTVENAGFEESGEEVPGWALLSGKFYPNGILTTTKDEAYSGSSSLKITSEGAEPTAYSAGIFGVRDGFTYTASAMVKGDLTPSITLKFYNMYSMECATATVPGTVSADWTAMTVSAVAPSGAVFARVLVGGAGTGGLFVDKVSLVEAPLLNNDTANWTEADGGYVSADVKAQPGLTYLLTGNCVDDGASCAVLFKDADGNVLQTNSADGMAGEETVLRAIAPADAATLQVKVNAQAAFSGLKLDSMPYGTQVPDGSFERLAAGDGSSWEFKNTTAETALKNVLVTDGVAGVTINAGASATSDLIPVLGGKEYIATVDARSTSVGGARFRVITYGRTGGVSAGYDVYTTAANTNEKLQISFVPDRGAVNARVILYGQGGVSMFDNAQVYAISDSASNYSFEDVNAYNKVGNFAKQWQVYGDVQALTVSDPEMNIPSSAMAVQMNGVGEGGMRSSMIRAQDGLSYTARILASSDVGGSLRIAFYNDKFVRLTTGAEVSFSGNTWTKYTATATAPTGTAYAVLDICADEGDSFAVDAAEFTQTVLDVEDNTQMFIDDYVIASTDLTRTLHQAEKSDVLLGPDENSWTKSGKDVYGTVLYDEQEGIFKMWYLGINLEYASTGDVATCMLCYATSVDGINWDEPILGLYEYDGSTENNIIGNITIPSVFKDMDEPDPAKRYKMIGYTHDKQYSYLHSPDGLHWTKESSIVGGDVITAAYSESEDLYFSYVKQGLSGKRDQFTMVSDGELGKWSMPIASPANSDIIDSKYCYLADSYGMGLYEKDGNYIGFNWVFDIPGSNIMEGVIETQLSYSRDLKEDWQRPTRTPLIPRGEEGAIDDGMVMTSCYAIEVGDEVWMYTVGIDGDHHGDALDNKYYSYLSKWRMDGFMSMDGTGTLTTKAMNVGGAELLLNADASKGSIKAELLDANGTPIPGYTKDDFNTITSDSVEHRLTWGDSANVTALAGQAVSLKLYSENSEIYSFRFSGTVPLEGIDVEDSVMVKAGETVQLSAAAKPETAELESVKWTSSNANIATVDNTGLVTAVAPGRAVITVSSDGRSAECVVTVTEAETGFTGPTLSWSLLYEQDFEDETDTTFAAAQGIYGAVNTKVTRDEVDGTYAAHIKGSNTSTTPGHATYSWATTSKTIGSVTDAGLGIDKGCVAQFDVYKVSDGLPLTAYWRSEYLNIYNAVGLPTSNFPENNRWYTVTIEASGNYWRDNKSGKVYVSIKDNVTGEVKPGTYYNSYAPFGTTSCFGFICDARVKGATQAANFGNTGYITGSGTALENAAATDYYIDNVKLYNRTAVAANGVNMYKDWDSLRGDGASSLQSPDTISKHTVVAGADGNTYRTVEALANSNQYTRFAANGDDLEMSNRDFTISIDVVKLAEGNSLNIGYHSGEIMDAATSNAVYSHGYAIPACSVEKDVWYSYRIVRKDGALTAYRKTRDGNDPFVEVGVETLTNTSYTARFGDKTPVLDLNNGWSNSYDYRNSVWIYAVNNINRLANGCTGTAMTGTKWGYDNLVVTEGNAMTVESINLGLDANSIVTKVALKTAEAVSGILPVVGYYDANNRLVFVEYDNVVNADATDIKSAWYLTERDSDGTETRESYLGTIGAGGYAKAFIWNTDAAIPMLEAIDVTNIVK